MCECCGKPDKKVTIQTINPCCGHKHPEEEQKETDKKAE